MKLRLAQPETLIDINGLTELCYLDGGRRRAADRRADQACAAARLGLPPGEHFAILHDAERVIADPIVRNWGTVGGSLCQADPSEDLSAAFAALKATMVIRGQDGSRRCRPGSSTPGRTRPWSAPAEMLTEIRIHDPARRRQRVREGGPPGRRLAGRCGRGRGLAGRRHRRPDAGIGLTAVGARHFAAPRPRSSCAARPPRRRASPGPARSPPSTAGRCPTSAARPTTSGTWPASSPSARCAGRRRRARGEAALSVQSHGDRQRHRAHPRRRAAAAADPLPARRSRAHRLALGLRHLQLRRLRGLAGRDAGEVVHGARGHGRRPPGPDRRGPGTRGTGSTRSSRASRSATGCSAGSARRA